MVAEDAFDLADAEIQEALRPAVARIASLVDATTTERLSPTTLYDWQGQHIVLQGREAWDTFRDWLDRTSPRLGWEAASKLQAGSAIDNATVAAARKTRAAIVQRLESVLGGGKIGRAPV